MESGHTHDAREKPSKRDLIAHIRAQHPELIGTAHPLESWTFGDVQESHNDMHETRDRGLRLREFKIGG